MILSDKFTFIHQPKTGGTFVREALWEIKQAEQTRLRRTLRRLGLVGSSNDYTETDDYHGTCRDIPAAHAHKPILSIVRNPFDYYVSFYHFGWWASHPEDSYSDVEAVKRSYPHFPNLSFEEFLNVSSLYFNEYAMIDSPLTDAESRPGYYTTQFMLYYFKDPACTYRKVSEAYIDRQGWADDMFDIHFMRTHNLNRDLYEYLASIGYEKTQIKAVLSKGPARPAEQLTQRPSKDYENYYTDSSREFVLRKEKLLFKMFPELG